jgi:hypothetical protein
MSLQAVVDAEHRGSEARNGSRFNAVTHGLTAKTPVLPGESAAEFQARIDRYKTGLEPRNGLEEELAERAAMASWQLDRASRAEVARLARSIHTEPAMAAFRENQRAEALGNRLFFDRRGPVELYPSRDYDNYKQPRTSSSEVADDPDDPAVLVAELETTLAGCRWLRGRWDELREMLESGLGWQSQEKLKAVRLLGRQPLQAVSVREVAEVFLACHVVEPQFSYAFQELRCEIDEDRFKRYKHRLSRRNLEAITPADATAARAVLLRIVEKATERLRMLESKHQRVADIVDRLQTDVLSFDESKSGEQIRRLQASCNRLLLRNLDAIHKGRRNEAGGWGRTKQQREERKQDGKHRRPGDERLVVDERGSVRNADGYEGNLEEGLARFEAQIGRQPFGTNEARREVEESAIPAVPDFARWCPLTIPDVDGGAEESRGQTDGTVGAEETCGQADGGVGDPRRTEGTDDGAGDARRTENSLVTLVVTEIGEGANIQNETGGQANGGARDPRRTEEADGGDATGARAPRRTADEVVPVVLTEKGEGVNIQNETFAEAFLTGEDEARVSREGERSENDGNDARSQEEQLIDGIQSIALRLADVLQEHLPRSP